MSIVHKVDQGSREWYRVRIGKPTASMFHKIVTPTGKLSEQRTKYMYRLIAERLLQESMDDPIHSEWMERGREMEPYAATQFAFLEDCVLEPVGFVTDDTDRIGCSPDRLISGRNEAVEIKCPAPWTQIGRLLDGTDADYKPQVQGQLLVGGFERVHLYSYSDRMPAVHLITLPDPYFQKQLERHVWDFCDQLEDATYRARKMGVYAASPMFETPFEKSAPPPEPKINLLPE